MPNVHKYVEHLSDLRRRVAYTGRELLELSRKWQSFSSKPPSNCDVVVTFVRHTTDEQIDWISGRLRARIPELLFTRTFHSSTQRHALYLTCAFKE
uniref:MTS domain-containing protein n=1 Tax=Mesocestoides corti TaxID=53468 RepID=A0A5K3FZJ6_MESCO